MGYQVGQKVIVFCRFTRARTAVDPPGTPERVPEDPGAVTLTVEKPDGTEEDRSGDVTHPADPETGNVLGYFAAAIEATSPGRWRYRFAGTDPVHAPDEGSFYVERSFVDSLNG